MKIILLQINKKISEIREKLSNIYDEIVDESIVTDFVRII